MIKRNRELGLLVAMLDQYPVVAMIGARQVGKSTLAHALTAERSGPVEFFDLENPEDAGRLADPMLALRDLRGVVVRGRIRLGFEIKRTSAPQTTPSMAIACRDLKLDGLTVVHAGEKTFPMGERIRAVPAAQLLEEVRPL